MNPSNILKKGISYCRHWTDASDILPLYAIIVYKHVIHKVRKVEDLRSLPLPLLGAGILGTPGIERVYVFHLFSGSPRV